MFAIATCYYGLGFRTRPGTLIVTNDAITHYSYSWRDTHFAMFEPSIPVIMPLPEIEHVSRLQLGFWQRANLAQPDACFEVVTRGGESHHLALHKAAHEFEAILTECGVTISQ
jgi:hypothetical protein